MQNSNYNLSCRRREMQDTKLKKSFTLVELMIVIAILAILSAIVIFALNPARLFDNFRDSKRVTDITSIHKAINFMETWNSSISYGTSTNVYISLPDSYPSCSSYALPTLPTGFAYYCKPTSTFKNTDGTGWIPINFTVEGSNKYLPILPVDPVNDSTYFYTYFPGGSYELTALLKNPNTNSINSEGNMTGNFIVGSTNRIFFTPLQRDINLIGYWKINEGQGTTAYDSSGNGLHGTFVSSPAWETLENGTKVLKLDGTDDYISLPTFAIPNVKNQLTIAAWVKFTDVNRKDPIFALDQFFLIPYLADGMFHLFKSTQENSLVVGAIMSDATAPPGFPGAGWNGFSDFFADTTNQWTSVVFVMDRSTGTPRSYKNGELSLDEYIGGNLLWMTSMNCKKRIGSDNLSAFGGPPATFAKGYIGEVRLYNRALTADEVRKLYNTTKGLFNN